MSTAGGHSPTHAPATRQNCAGDHASKAGRTIALPQVGSTHQVRLGGSRTGRWRAVVLTLVNLAIAIHVIQWMVRGSTLSPVEPSESMKTLEEGVVNTGFVFFSAALLATLVFGRFFCGWGCHIVALQDSCSWIMSRLGVRPRPFRSRLMLWIPLGIGSYMFLWPTFKRHVLTPMVGNEFGRLPNWLGSIPPIDRITQEFIVKDFWATFAPWYVAIPFFLVVGFAVVYFLGNKGFCTYGCPYGGFFAPLDLVSPGKIRVTDACEGCGHCTAVCTSNVRVHEEVRDFGMVVNPGCMKCMDCVNTCPNDALYFGFGKPAVLARPRSPEAGQRRQAKRSSLKQYDLTRGQEWAAVVLFVVLLWCYRSFLNEVPLLMAVGMAGIGVFVVWKLLQLARVPSARVQNVQLKLRGRLRPAGMVFIVLALVYLAAGAWGGLVRAELWRAEQAYAVLEESGPTIPQAIQAGFVPLPEHAAAANEAIRRYLRAGPMSAGGFGWTYSNESLARLAYMHAVVGKFEQSESFTRALLRRQKPNDNIVIDLARLMQRRGAPMEAIIAELRQWIEVSPSLVQTRNELAQALRAVGKQDEARREFEQAQEILGKSAKTIEYVGPTLRDHGYFELSLGNTDNAAELFKRSIEEAGTNLDVLVPVAAGLSRCGRGADAEKALDRADAVVAGAKHAPPWGTVLNIARGYLAVNKKDKAEGILRRLSADTSEPPAMLQAGIMLAQIGLVEEGASVAERAAGRAQELTEGHLGAYHRPVAANVNISAGGFLLQTGRVERGKALLEAGVKLGASQATFQMSAASQYLGVGDAASAVPLLELAAAQRPSDAALRHDLAVAYMIANRPAEAAKAMQAAAELAPTNAEFASRLAEIYRQIGPPAQAERWEQEAARRRGEGP
ncbi:MAG: 4Fe-4S binding protein [Phycisphaerales bacterium]